jgi:EAL domain-containing protein (putative c-di-GMP-specific phosphodiesterase class I)
MGDISDIEHSRAAHGPPPARRLHEALEAGEFVLHYQPKVDLACGTICGLEALMRWQDPQSGLVAPDDFLPRLEDAGLLLEAGNWAIRHALSQRLAWHIGGLRPPRIAVNVSAIQLRRGDFVRVIGECLDAVGVGEQGLDLDIAETLIMEDTESNIEKLRALARRGVNIAIDDFGTGHSSLAHLARLPVASIKIDRSFITRMTDSAHDMGIVKAILSVAHSTNLKVVAKGVETEAQRHLLRTLGCDRIQGHLVSKPLPAADVAALLRAAPGAVRAA